MFSEVFDGSRGDVQPYMVAAKALIMAGYDVMTSGPGDADALAKHFQVPTFANSSHTFGIEIGWTS